MLTPAPLSPFPHPVTCRDDCWSATERNATGHLQPNAEQFPNGLKPVADYIHSKGGRPWEAQDGV